MAGIAGTPVGMNGKGRTRPDTKVLTGPADSDTRKQA